MEAYSVLFHGLSDVSHCNCPLHNLVASLQRLHDNRERVQREGGRERGREGGRGREREGKREGEGGREREGEGERDG